MTFRDNRCGNILGIGKIGESSTDSMENIYLVNGLKYNIGEASHNPVTKIIMYDLMIPNVVLKIQ